VSTDQRRITSPEKRLNFYKGGDGEGVGTLYRCRELLGHFES
jgi:hypothetical protein